MHNQLMGREFSVVRREWSPAPQEYYFGQNQDAVGPDLSSTDNNGHDAEGDLHANEAGQAGLGDATTVKMKLLVVGFQSLGLLLAVVVFYFYPGTRQCRNNS